MKTQGIILAWVGVVIGWAGYLFAPTNGVLLIAVLLGVGLDIWGCYLWAKAKGHSGVFALWGILAPIGLLGVALLKNKPAASPPAV